MPPPPLPPELRSFLGTPRAAVVATLRGDGSPGRDYVSVKCRDPDGYVIEFAWDP
jgi:hypothetical protein